jgi:hypothetical protein
MDAILYGCTSLMYLNLINFDTSSISDSGYSSMFGNYNSQLVYCINETKIKNTILSQLPSGGNQCSNICFSNSNLKFIIDKNTCIDNCSKDNVYRYEYENLCYSSCPNGTHNSFDIDYLCEKDLECDNYYNYNHTECLDYILEGYYLNKSHYKTIYKCDIKCQNCSHESTQKNQCLSCNNNFEYYPKLNDESNYQNFVNCYFNLSEGYYLENKIYKSCFETCKKCTELGDINNHKCTECYLNYTLNETNCYEICQYYYYFDSSNQYHCTEKDECPENYKLIIDKKRCINKCSNDEIYIIECGEFEDLLTQKLFERALNYELQNISIPADTVDYHLPRVKILEDIFKKRGMHELKKVEFAKTVKKNILSCEDVSPEMRRIIEKIRQIKLNSKY